MNDRAFMSEASLRSMALGMWITITFTIPTVLSVPASLAGTPPVPWECSNYSEDAQTRCMKAYIERQQEQIGKLEAQLQAQQNTVGQLKGQLDQQSVAAADLQRQLSHRPAITVIPTPIYPSVGLGFYLGQPWVYGPPYYWYGRPFWGPRFYRYSRRHW